MRLLTALPYVFFLSAISACNSSSMGTRLSGADVADQNSDAIAYVRIPQSELTREFVQSSGFNRDHKRDDTFAFGYIERGALNRLSNKAVQQIVELDAEAWAQGNYDSKTLALMPDSPAAEIFEEYHNYDAMTAELQQLADTFPHLVTLESAGQSVQGRELWLVKISDNPEQDEAEPKLLYIANMHGDEVVGREMMIYLVRQLATTYETSERIRNLVNNAQIYVMPSMNPDGFERRSRYNANNADLNRNFPDFTSDPRDIPGNRQPETKAVMDLHARHHFVHALNYHGGDVCFNMPWDTKANARTGDRFGDDPLMQSLARKYADANPTMRVNSGGTFDRGVTYGYEWYEVDGGLQDWSTYYRRSFHATIELSYTKWPAASHLPVAWSENKESILSYLEQGIFGLHLKVRDESGAAIEGVTVGIASATRELTYEGPVIHRATLPGKQTARLSAAGFKIREIQVDPAAFDGTLTEVILAK